MNKKILVLLAGAAVGWLMAPTLEKTQPWRWASEQARKLVKNTP